MIHEGKEYGHAYDSALAFKEVTAPGTPPANYLKLYAKDSGGAARLFYKSDNGTEYGPLAEVPATVVTGTGTANRLAYWTGAQTVDDLSALTQGRVMFPDSNGLPTGSANLFWNTSDSRLGLNTALPLSTLHIVGSDANTSGRFRGEWSGALGAGSGFVQSFHLQSLPGAADQRLGLFLFGARTSDTDRNAAAIAAFSSQAWSAGTAQGAYLDLETTPNGSTTRAVRFRVGSAGQWGISGATYGTSGQAFLSGGASAAPVWTSLDHGTHLAGLTDDDHTQYALLAGRSGGQTLKGDTAASGKLILHSTDNATKGDIDLHSADITHLSGARHRMTGQNRFRYLNSMAKVYRTSNQTIANNTSTAVQLDNEEADTDALHDNVTNNTRITAALTGKYLVFGTATFSNNATGRRIMFLRRSGVDSLGADARNSCSSADAELLSTASIATFTAGQYMEMMVIQTSGGDLDLVSFGQSDISMGMVYLGE